MVRRRAQAGFTLKELAITTAVISALAMISYPFFQMWLIKVHGPTCQGNMRQLGLALVQYAQDDDQVLPSGRNASGNGWAGQLYCYTEMAGTYKCPDDPHEGSYISYAANQNVIKQNLNQLASPMSTVALYEVTTLGCDPSTPETASMTGLTAPQDSTRHDSSTFALNFVMVDGHVKRLRPRQISGGANAVCPKALPRGEAIATFAVQ